MKRILTVLTVAIFAVVFHNMTTAQQIATSPTTDETIKLVQATLDAQAAAWNEGDIPGFMAGYVNSESLRFASGNTVTTGWKTTLQRYRSRYTDRKIMGKLAFKDVCITPLSDSYAEVFGRFHLTRDSETGDATGLFTLLMKKTEKGWLVLHDHTSSASE